MDWRWCSPAWPTTSRCRPASCSPAAAARLPELAPALVSPAWLRRLPFEGIPSVGFLPPREVRGATDRTQRLLGPQDVPILALARLAAVADHPETLQDKLLKKVIGEHTVPLRR